MTIDDRVAQAVEDAQGVAMRYYVDHFQDGRYEIMDTRTDTSIARLYSREVAFRVVELLNDADDAEREGA